MPKRRVTTISLDSIPATPPRGTRRDRIKKLTDEYEDELADLDDLLYSARQHSMLVVFQGRDTAGKDGAIRKILDHSNAVGVRVESFKVPTDEELAHDFLWRVHARTPGKGQIVLFNRSHYEDVIVTRVHKLLPARAIESRYEAINAFERLLVDSGTIIVKFFLHITVDEQKERLLEREEEREKAWKLAVGDWKEREYWDDYTRAYDVAMTRCSTPDAPWHVVPSDKKWYRNYIVLKTVVEALRPYRQGWLDHLGALGGKRKAEIDAWKREGADTPNPPAAP